MTPSRKATLLPLGLTSGSSNFLFILGLSLSKAMWSNCKFGTLLGSNGLGPSLERITKELTLLLSFTISPKKRVSRTLNLSGSVKYKF